MLNSERQKKRVRPIVALTLDPDVVKALESMAAAEMRSRSNFVEVVIRRMAAERGQIIPTTEAKPCGA